jgi:hypothetical protein
MTKVKGKQQEYRKRNEKANKYENRKKGKFEGTMEGKNQEGMSRAKNDKT